MFEYDNLRWKHDIESFSSALRLFVRIKDNGGYDKSLKFLHDRMVSIQAKYPQHIKASEIPNM